MTKDKLNELFVSAQHNIADKHKFTDCEIQLEADDVTMEFARALLFECAKTACINCKEGNESRPTKDSNRRVHQLTDKYSESCRAPSFFIEGE